MKIIKFITIGLLIAGATLLSSCKKEGCTDPSAENYCDECKKEDHSCQFKGEIVFWYNQTAANGLANDGATSLTYYVDGQIVGSSAASVYWTGAPNCGQNSSITVSKSLGNVKNKSYDYSVKDQTGYTYWSGTANFTANTCATIQLTW